MATTVSVGCKLPHGLKLQLFALVEGKAAKAIGKPVTIKGANATFGESNLIVPVGSFGITDGVDAEFMKKWMHDNRDMEAVKLGQIFVHEKAVSVHAEGKAKREQPNGFEGADPKKLPKGLKVASEDGKEDKE